MTSAMPIWRCVRRIQLKRAGSDRTKRRIDHEDFEEIGDEPAIFAQIVDHIADRHIFMHGNKLALHDAPGRFLRIGKRGLDGSAVIGFERVQDFGLVALFHILDDCDRVVGFECRGETGNLFVIQLVDQRFADEVVHLGEHFAVEQFCHGRSQRSPVFAIDGFEQVRHVGRMEMSDQFACGLGVLRAEAVDHGFDEFGLQPVFVIEAGFFFGFGGIGRGVAHVHASICFAFGSAAA